MKSVSYTLDFTQLVKISFPNMILKVFGIWCAMVSMIVFLTSII